MVFENNATPLSLDHQGLLESLWKPLCSEEKIHFAEYSFANAYLFRKRHHYQLLNTDPPYVAGIESQLGHHYLIPTRAPEGLKPESLKAAAKFFPSHMCSGKKNDSSKSSLQLFPVPDHWLPRMEVYHPSLSSSRAEADYLFKVEKLKTLEGRTLSSRRNLLHQLESHHSLESKVLTVNEHSDALAILDQWQQEVTTTRENNDYYSCREAIELMDRLKLFGRIAYADGKPIGFTIGEFLTPQTVLLHMSKAVHSVKGATPYLYQDFSSHLPDSVEWINFEQDLGLPSLRQAKSAYDPDLLATKWHVSILV